MKTLFLFLYLAQSPVAITMDPSGSFHVTGWPDAAFSAREWTEIFTVQVDVPDVPPLLGSYRVEQGGLVFVPQFPAQPGVSYRATLKIPGREPVVERFALPKPDMTPTTTVERFYPSASVLPENQLKFYIHFSAPMSRGEAYSRVHLLDETTGMEVGRPFLTLTEELWDGAGKRFTLFFDPGRVKRDLVPNRELGTPLVEGKKYTFVVDDAWLDADSKPLKRGFRKSFAVGPADRKALDQSTWRVVSPKAGTREPVSVEFPEAMDHAILQRQLGVMDASQNIVEGSIEVDRDETRWRFIPKSPWKAGSYLVQVGTVVADLAGNMVDHPFDVDVFEKVDESIVRETRDLPFTVN